jgi:hypothetical protein
MIYDHTYKKYYLL